MKIRQELYNLVGEELAGLVRKYDIGKGKVIGKRFGVGDKQIDKNKCASLAMLYNRVMREGNYSLAYFDDMGVTYVYNGRYYERVGDGSKFFGEVIRISLEKLGVIPLYCVFASRIISDRIIESLNSLVEFKYRPDRRYIIFTNGVFDLSTGRLNDFSPKYVSDLVLDFAYNSRAGCLLWDIKIKEIIPEVDFRKAFQAFCGSLLVDRSKLKVEYICYLVGTGSNGKSVLASAIAGVFGDEYITRFSPKQLFRDSDARVNIAELQGKVCNIVGDLNERDISYGDFKRFVSGEIFQGRRNYKDPIQVRVPPLLCCTNSLPESGDDSYGYYRRQLPIYTTRHQWTQQDRDPYLASKLSALEARQYIFNWIYAGYKRIVKDNGNIELGDKVLMAIEDMRADSNSPRRWWRDCRYIMSPDGRDDLAKWYNASEIFEDYAVYCRLNGDKNVGVREFNRIVRSFGVKERRVGTGFQWQLADREKLYEQEVITEDNLIIKSKKEYANIKETELVQAKQVR